MRDFLVKYCKGEVIRYLIVSYLSVVLNLILNVISIKYLSSSDLGRVTLGKSIFQSFDFSHFGMRFGLDRHLPAIESQSKRIEIFGVAFLSSVISSSIFLIFWSFYTIHDFWFYFTFYFSGLLYALIAMCRVFYRAENVKRDFIYISSIVNVLPIFFQIVGLFIWGITGLVVGGVLGYATCFLLIFSKFPVKISMPNVSGFIVFKKLFGSGIVLFLSAGVSFFSTIGDRFIIESYWGLDILGIFSVIMFVFSIFNLFAVNYTEMIMNKIVQTKSFNFVFVQALKLIFLTSIFVVICYFLLPYFVRLLLPKYASYTEQMKNILLGAIPFSCLPIFNHYLHSIDKRNILLAINILSTMVYFVFLLIILKKQISLDSLIHLKNMFYLSISILTLGFSIFFSRTEIIRPKI